MNWGKANKPVAMEVTLMQPMDSCGSAAEDVSWLTIKTQDAGGGNYIVIETDRWAIGDEAEIDEFATALKAMLRQVEES